MLLSFPVVVVVSKIVKNSVHCIFPFLLPDYTSQVKKVTTKKAGSVRSIIKSGGGGHSLNEWEKGWKKGDAREYRYICHH